MLGVLELLRQVKVVFLISALLWFLCAEMFPRIPHNEDMDTEPRPSPPVTPTDYKWYFLDFSGEYDLKLPCDV